MGIIMNKLLLILSLTIVCLGGCVTNEFAYEQIAKTPKYFQSNIGPVKAEPFSPFSLILAGYVNSNEPNCPIHLFRFKNNFIVWHEAFHSFEMKSYLERNDEWKLFQNEFGDDHYLNHLVTLVMTIVPFIEYTPYPGKVRFYGNMSKIEDTADCFAYWMKIQQGKKPRKDKILQRKLAAIEKFVTGSYILGEY